VKTYDYCTDAESGEVEADSLQEALDEVKPTAREIADGAFAWVEDPDTGERLYCAKENEF
jgi:hypothetical protein